MASTPKPPSLRDLANDILKLTQDHPCYSQAINRVMNLYDHLCAIAGVSELNARLRELEIEARERKARGEHEKLNP